MSLDASQISIANCLAAIVTLRFVLQSFERKRTIRAARVAAEASYASRWRRRRVEYRRILREIGAGL